MDLCQNVLAVWVQASSENAGKHAFEAKGENAWLQLLLPRCKHMLWFLKISIFANFWEIVPRAFFPPKKLQLLGAILGNFFPPCKNFFLGIFFWSRLVRNLGEKSWREKLARHLGAKGGREKLLRKVAEKSC